MRPLLLLLSLLLLASCGGRHVPGMLALPVVMQTEEGVAVAKVDPPRTMERENVPVGVDPDDVVAHVEDKKTGEEVWVVKSGIFRKQEIYHKPASSPVSELQIDVARRSWAWLWWTLGVLAGLVVAGRSIDKITKPIDIIMRIFKK